MRRFDPADPLDLAAASAEHRDDAPRPARRRPARTPRVTADRSSKQLTEHVFPSWARLPARSAAAADLAAGAAFSAGAGLALFDQILRADPSFAGALRQRLALRAAAVAAMMLRLREDEGALRDAEHLASGEGETSPAGRVHRLWRSFAAQSARPDAERLRAAAGLLDIEPAVDAAAVAGGLAELDKEAGDPLALATLTAAFVARALAEAPRGEAEILALWAADLMQARRLGWEHPVPLLTTTILHPSLRAGSAGRRPRPGDPAWPEAVARAYALAARDAYALAGELARRGEELSNIAPNLRAQGAGRVVALLLADDAVSPARAARMARLSDRAARRLFDRLVALGVVRELTGRSSFRLYGL